MEKVSVRISEGEKNYLKRFEEIDMTTEFQNLISTHIELVKKGANLAYEKLTCEEFQIICSCFMSTSLVRTNHEFFKFKLIDELENPYELMYVERAKINKILDKIKDEDTALFVGLLELVKRVKEHKHIKFTDSMEAAGVLPSYFDEEEE